MKINTGSLVLDTLLESFYPNIEFFYQDPEIRSYLNMLNLKETGKGMRCVVHEHKTNYTETEKKVLLKFTIKTTEPFTAELLFNKTVSGFLLIDDLEELLVYGKALDLITCRGGVHFYQGKTYKSRQILKEEVRDNKNLFTILSEEIKNKLKVMWKIPEGPEETVSDSSIWDEF